ncbi:MAG: ubiquitin-like domain-containing protein [Anaerolineae bacterium]
MKPADSDPPRPQFSFSPNTFARRSANVPIHPLLLLLILLLVFAIIIGVGAYYILAKPVTLIIEDVPQQVRTHQLTVEGMLRELGALVDPEDVVAPSLDTPITYNLVVTIDKAETVILAVDGETRRFRTHLEQPLDILAEAGIQIGADDATLVDGVALSADSAPLEATPREIVLVRALQITLVDDGTSRPITVTARTVGAALAEADVALFVADRVTPDLEAPLAAGDTIIITRSVPLLIRADGQTLHTRTLSSTVAAALQETGIAPIGLDYAVPPESTPITTDMTIRLVRVIETEMVTRRIQPFARQRRIDRTLAAGQQKIIQQGADGLIEEHVIIRYEDGIEVQRSAPRIIVVQAAVAEIIAVAPSISSP